MPYAPSQTRCRTRFRFALVLLLAAGAALAAPELTLEITAERRVETVVDGTPQEQFVDAAQAARDDVLRYTLVYVNRGDDPATQAAITNPIPDGTAYLAGSGETAHGALVFSADGGRSFHTPPLLRTRTLADGTTRVEEIPADEYTHLRWQLPESIDPGASGTARYRVTVR